MPTANDTVSQLPWQLDKKGPIALILAILLQTAGGAWFAAKQTDVKTTDAIVGVREAMAGYRSTMESMRASLDRIERGIDNKR